MVSWLLALLVACAGAVSVSETLSTTAFSAHDFVLYSRPFVVPVTVRVVLLGLDSDAKGRLAYHVDEKALAGVLARALPTRRIHVLESGRRLQVQYQMTYNVVHLRDLALDGKAPSLAHLEEVLDRTIKAGGSNGHLRAGRADVPVAVDAKLCGLETLFAGLYAVVEGQQQQQKLDHTIFVMHASGHSDTRPPYTYVYNGGSVGAPVWCSSHRFAVIDMGAIGVQLGSLDAAEGARMPASFPSARATLLGLSADERIAYRDTSRVPLLDAKLAATVVSAVQHLVLPDVLFEGAPQKDAQQLVLIPVMVFRNHNKPFRPDDRYEGEAYDFDVARVVREIHGLQLPGAQVRVVFKVHTMGGAHQSHVEAALQQALEMRVRHRLLEDEVVGASGNPARRYQAIKTEFVNGGVLLDALQHFTPDLTHALVKELGDAGKDLQAAMFGGARSAAGARASPVRLFPVYVFSLRGHAADLLFEDSAPLFADARGAVVLQSNFTDVAVPYFGATGELVRYNPSDSTRPIIDSLMRGLGNMAPPHLSWSEARNRTATDFTWSTGCTTHGFFSGARELSQMARDNARRTAALLMVDHMMRACQRVLDDVRRFDWKHIRAPVTMDATSLLAHVRSPRVALRASASVKMSLKEMQQTLVQLLDIFTSARNDELFTTVAQLPVMAQRLLESSGDTLADAEAALACCSWNHYATRQTPYGFVLLLLLVVAGGAGAFVALARRASK